MDESTPADSIQFTGNWREYAPIALSNLALTIVTLGIYRFWAVARERRYLWSRTMFIDDTLEWAGTGKEMFFGFLMAMLVVLLPLFILNVAMQALLLRGNFFVAGIIGLGLYLGILFLVGFARFRALRYRLSRTYWHGIRGGSDDPGASYGVAAIWKTLVGALAAGLLVPWSMTSLWNDRWNKMSFGAHGFSAFADSSGLMARWLVLLFSPIVVIALIFGSMFGVAASNDFDPESGAPGAMLASVVLLPLVLYSVILVAGVAYFAAYFRNVIDATRWDSLEFSFTARSKDWWKLLAGDIGLLIVTLGIGICFLGYRHWSFFIRHLGASGEIDLDHLTQSTTARPREAEGFADAFDIGAI